MRLQDSAAASLIQSKPAQLVGGGFSVVMAALLDGFTGTMFFVMVGLFACDILAGVAKAINVGGLKAFCADRFMRGLAKFVAALIAVVVSVLADLLLQELGIEGAGGVATGGVLGFVCLGFMVSAVRNLGHFFPWVEVWLDSALRKVRNPDETPARRASDRTEEPVEP